MLASIVASLKKLRRLFLSILSTLLPGNTAAPMISVIWLWLAIAATLTKEQI
jgi:hypothetical protein